MVSLHYNDPVKNYSLDFFFYLKEKFFRECKISPDFQFQTKMDMAAKILETNAPRTNARTFIFDLWYFSQKIIKNSESLEID